MLRRIHYPILWCGLLATPLVLVASPLLAQQQDEQLWLQVNTNVPVADGVRVTFEQIARFSDRQDGMYQTEFGGLLGWRIARGVELGFGYRKVGAHNGNTGVDEDRLRQQVVATFGPVTTRLRIDERSTRVATRSDSASARSSATITRWEQGGWRCSPATRASFCPTARVGDSAAAMNGCATLLALRCRSGGRSLPTPAT